MKILGVLLFTCFCFSIYAQTLPLVNCPAQIVCADRDCAAGDNLGDGFYVVTCSNNSDEGLSCVGTRGKIFYFTKATSLSLPGPAQCLYQSSDSAQFIFAERNSVHLLYSQNGNWEVSGTGAVCTTSFSKCPFKIVL